MGFIYGLLFAFPRTQVRDRRLLICSLHRNGFDFSVRGWSQRRDANTREIYGRLRRNIRVSFLFSLLKDGPGRTARKFKSPLSVYEEIRIDRVGSGKGYFLFLHIDHANSTSLHLYRFFMSIGSVIRNEAPPNSYRAWSRIHPQPVMMPRHYGPRPVAQPNVSDRYPRPN